MNYYKEVVYYGCTSGDVSVMFNFDSKVNVLIRANVIDEELRNKGSEGNERRISEIKVQIMLVSGQ